MQQRSWGVHLLLLALFVGLPFAIASPADAAVDACVARYLHVTEPAPLVLDAPGWGGALFSDQSAIGDWHLVACATQPFGFFDALS